MPKGDVDNQTRGLTARVVLSRPDTTLGNRACPVGLPNWGFAEVGLVEQIGLTERPKVSPGQGFQLHEH